MKMIKVIQTIALEDGNDFNNYNFFKTKNGDYGFFDYVSGRWCLARTECKEFCVYPCSINNPSLAELNDWVREDDDAIIGFFNGTVKFEEINND